MRAKQFLFGVMTACYLALASTVSAQVDTGADTSGQTSPGGPGCYDAEVFSGKLISGVCWECVLPIVVSRVVIAGDKERIPEGSATGSFIGACMCYDNLGLPNFGIRTSLWQPARLIELQRLLGRTRRHPVPF